METLHDVVTENILKDAGLEHLRFHDLRHTFATLAFQNGVDTKVVSGILGYFSAGSPWTLMPMSQQQPRRRQQKPWKGS